MKIVLLCNHQVSLFAIQDLMRRGCLAGIVTSNMGHGFMTEAALVAKSQNIPYFQCGEYQLENGLVAWLGEIAPDALVVVTFPFRLPQVVLDFPAQGCWNFHFGLLPEYRGPDPTFWTLKNGDAFGGLTVHRMTARFDEGPILFRKEEPIAAGDVLGTHLNRVAQHAPEGLEVLMNYLENGQGELTEGNLSDGRYMSRPTPEDLTIDWNQMDAKEIECLVRAANPSYQGAVSMFRKISVCLHEVEVMPLSEPPNEPPGTIVDAPGNPNLYILCRDSACLWVKVASVPDGVFSGERLREVFNVSSGERFQNPGEVDKL